jgi:hypothetical protein
MERIPVIMINRDLSHLPRFNLPEGFFVRAFTHEDDAVWAKVESAAGEFKTTGEALRHFHEEFGNHLQELRHRCIFV